MWKFSMRFDVWATCHEAQNVWGPEAKPMVGSPGGRAPGSSLVLAIFKDQNQHFKAQLFFLRIFYYYYYLFCFVFSCRPWFFSGRGAPMDGFQSPAWVIDQNMQNVVLIRAAWSTIYKKNVNAIFELFRQFASGGLHQYINFQNSV